MTSARAVFPLIVCLTCGAIAQENSASGWRLFPSSRVFPKLLADGTAPGISLNKDLRTRLWIGGIGGLTELLQWSRDDLTVQLGVGANVYASLNRKPRVLEVLTADFYVYFPLDVQIGSRVVLRTGYGHFSAHLADDGIEMLGFQSINYAKDYIYALGAVSISEIGGFVYGGARIDYYTIPERGSHWVLQAGFEAGNVRLTEWMATYVAFDLKCKSEVSWGVTQSYQAGMKIAQTPGKTLRIAFTFRTGIDDRGQFYRNRVTLHLLGISLDV